MFADRIKVAPGVWLGLQNNGINPLSVLRQAQLPLSVYHAQAGITTRQYFALWQAIYDVTADAAIGLKLSHSLPTEKLSPGLLDAYHARDYRDALQRMVRYIGLCNPQQLALTDSAEHCSVQFSWQYGEQNEPAILLDTHMATLMEIGRRGSGQPIRARRVELMASGRDVSAHINYFGCQVIQGAAQNSLHFYPGDLSLPFISYNAELLDLLTPLLDKQLADNPSRHSLSETVSWLIKHQISGGRPDISAIAGELGLSYRTLQRRLLLEGTGYQELLTRVRRYRAHELLADEALDLNEVALLLGYEDQSSFFRAFKKWENITPSEWRTLHQAQAGE